MCALPTADAAVAAVMAEGAETTGDIYSRAKGEAENIRQSP